MIASTGVRQAVELEDGVVIYINGIRLNRLRGLPQYLMANWKVAKMFRRLEADPDSGFLGYEPALMGPRHGAAIQYWRSLEDLERFASDREDMHAPAWRWFNRVDDGSIGLWSELYVIGPDDYETFFRNVEGVGLSRFGDLVPMAEHERRFGLAGSVARPEESVATTDGGEH